MPEISQDEIDAMPNTLHYGPKGIPIEEIIDLRSRGLSISQIGRLTDCSKANVSKRLQRQGNAVDLTHKFRKNRAFILAYHQQRVSQELTDAKIKKAKFIDLVKGLSFLHNQERLEEGLSTQNIAYADIVRARAQIKAEIASLEAEYGRVEEAQVIDVSSDNG